MTNIKNALTFDGLNTRIDAWGEANKLTKKEAGQLSRDVIRFVFVEGNDRVELADNLIAAANPATKKVLIAFFRHHLPWTFVDGKFVEKFDAGKKSIKKLEDSKALLADPMGTVWTWQAAKDEPEAPKAPTFAADLTKLVQKALKGKKMDDEYVGAVKPHEILLAVIAGGVDSSHLMTLIDDITASNKAEIAAEVAANPLVIDVPAKVAA